MTGCTVRHLVGVRAREPLLPRLNTSPAGASCFQASCGQPSARAAARMTRVTASGAEIRER